MAGTGAVLPSRFSALGLGLLVALTPLLAFPALSENAPVLVAVTEDGGEDVKLYGANEVGVPAVDASATGQADLVDILKVWLGGETETSFQVGIQMKALPNADSKPPPFRMIHFRLDDTKYRVVAPYRWNAQDLNKGQLEQFNAAANQYRPLKLLESQTDAASQSLLFTVPRELVTNSKHVPVRYGEKLEDVNASAIQTYVNAWFLPDDPTGGVYVYDRAPNAGSGTPYQMFLGRTGEGGVSLYSDDPIRVSNGESTTIVYKVDLKNSGKERERYQIETREVRSDWSVRAPTLLEVKPGEQVTFPVILSVPFTHDHGKTETFELRALSLDSSNEWSTLQLGIHWTETPQPAGHHPDMWFHSSPMEDNPFGPIETVVPLRSAWMNPLVQDETPGTDDQNIPGFVNKELWETLVYKTPRVSGTTWTVEWWFPLTPALLIGLDFDPEKEINFATRIKHFLPATESRLNVALLYCDPQITGESGCVTTNINNDLSRWTPLANGTSAPRSADAQAVAEYALSMRPEPAADHLPFKRGANLGLRLRLLTNIPANTFLLEPRPELLVRWGTGGADERAKLTLPLIEYHDPIDRAFQGIGSLGLDNVSPLDKRVNPGRTAVYWFRLNNTGQRPHDLQLELHGDNVAWARLTGDPRLRLAPGESRMVEVAIQPPPSAHAEERAELVLVAQSLSDVTVVAAIRLRSTVVEGTEIPDESNLLEDLGPAHGSPGPQAGLLLLSVGLLAWVGRRRR